MSSVTFDHVSRRFPRTDRPAVDDFSLEIADGELLVLVGPSGCGKSTCLRMLAGLEEVSSGRVFIGADDVTGVLPRDRDVAMVFQNYALYPHLTVAENMAFALQIARTPRAERRARVLDAAQMLDLEPYLDRRPAQLSGGQRQRVAMGRAIVRRPAVFCMDEPLSNLDAKLRVQTRLQIAMLQERLGITTLYVTHDQVEAMTMGDRIAVMKDGVLQQVDVPSAVYDRPVNSFVAGFIGSPAMNLFDCPVDDGHALVGDGRIPLVRTAVDASIGRVTVGIRPEHWVMCADGDGDGVGLEAVAVEDVGSDTYLYARLAGHEPTVVVRLPARASVAAGQRVRVRPDLDQMHLFDSTTGRRSIG